ncbi:MAG: AI-2E family transporter [Ignavibacteriota bacterium]
MTPGKRITSFLTMNFLVNAGYGLCFGIGLSVIGIPYATLWGVIASVLRFVPYIGYLHRRAAAVRLLTWRLRALGGRRW